MNEITQFCDGECPDNKSESTEAGNDSLPFNPFGDNNDYGLESRTIPIDSKFHYYNDQDKDSRIGYNVHSLYSLLQAQDTYFYFQYDFRSPNPNARNFITTRSSFAGSGKYASHYISNHGSTFEDMKQTISTILSFQLFGMPTTGADVCGSDDYFDAEVCARWMQLASVYPIARVNYNGTFGLKEPWNLEGKYKTAAINAIRVRYSLIRYFYTVLFEAYINGGSFWRPLFFEYPNCNECMKDIEKYFMVGKSIKVTPVLSNATDGKKFQTSLPAESEWIDLFDLHHYSYAGNTHQYFEIEASWDWPSLHLRGGRILPYQDYNVSMTTYDLVNNRPISLLVFPDKTENAAGAVYVDKDGLSEETIYEETYQYYKITYSDKKLRFVLTKGRDSGGQLDANQILDKIILLNGENYKNTTFACMFDENMDYSPINFQYNEGNNTFHLFVDQNNDPLELRTLKGIQFGNNETDENLCGTKYFVENVSKESNGLMAGKVLTVENGPNYKGLMSFTAKFTLLKDNLINVDFSLDQSKVSEFEIPSVVLNDTLYPIKNTYSTGDISSYVTVAKPGEEFYFEIHAKDNPKDILFSTKGEPLTYTLYYKSMGSKLYTDGKVFGLGERVGEFWLGAGTYTIWNRGPEVQVEEDGQRPGKNLYGSHPVMYVKRKNNEFFAIYEHNSGPQDYILAYGKTGFDLTSIKTSGRTNMFFLMNESLQKVTQNYYELVGKPVLPPEWAFGWHQSRFGYKDTNALRDVLKGYRNASIPLDAIWSDVDYLDDFKDFTIDEEMYSDLAEFVEKEVHAQNMKWVPIIGSGISAGDSSAYNDAKKAGVLIQSNKDNKEPIIGRNTPGDVVFIDFFDSQSESYWLKQFDKFFKKVAFDGVWLDMNEITDYCEGVCYENQRAKQPVDNKLLYWPGGRDLETGTLSLDAVHEGGWRELDTHSVYGIIESYRTKRWYDQRKERPFIMSRSTFAGSGKYGGHWTGDNNADYDSMGNSVTSAHLFNFFGIPFVGSDICGFNGNTSAFECSKWYKIGAIYPFARNHNNLNTLPQEPYIDAFNTKVDFTYNYTAIEIIRKASLIRYSMHVYQYTQFHKASTDGIPPFRPLFYDFPSDQYSYKYVESNVMLGPNIKASPHFTSFERSTYYFPEPGSFWCSVYESKYKDCFDGGSYQNINIAQNEVILHLKSGSIVPLQLTFIDDTRNTTGIYSMKDLENSRTELAVLLNKDKKASGDVRFDGGLTTNLTDYDEIKFNAIPSGGTFSYSELNITFTLTNNKNPNPNTPSQTLSDILIYRASKGSFMEKTTGNVVMKTGEKIPLKSVYVSKMNFLRVSHDGKKDLYYREIAYIHLKANAY